MNLRQYAAVSYLILGVAIGQSTSRLGLSTAAALDFLESEIKLLVRHPLQCDCAYHIRFRYF